MYSKLYKTSEFAKLCGVSKHTLFHYDDIGLLTPSGRTENGYRYYTIEQYKKFGLIVTLVELGTSLTEIKEYVTSMREEDFLHILKQKLAEVEEQSKRVLRMGYILSDSIYSIEKKAELYEGSGSIRFVEMEKELLIATKTHLHEKNTEAQMLIDIRNHMDYVSDNNILTGLNVGEIILKEDIDSGTLVESYYYSKTTLGVSDPHLLVKPSGLYAIKLYKGNIDYITDFYKEMLQELKDSGYEVAGSLYELDLIDYKFELNNDNYLSSVAIQVEKKR